MNRDICHVESCTKSVVDGRSKCERHLEANRLYMARVTLTRKASGTCKSCGAQPIAGLQTCERHALMRVKQNATRYSKRVNKGECTTCGKPSSTGKKKCKACADNDRRIEISLKNDRRMSGRCIYCGGEVETHTPCKKRTSCDACRKRHKGYDGTISSRFSRARTSVNAVKRGWTLKID